jgi:hypothetical protein
MSRMKQRPSFTLAFSNVRSKFLAKLLHCSIQTLKRSMIHRVMTGTIYSFALSDPFSFRWPGCQLQANLAHDLRVVLLQGTADGIRIITVARAEL